MLKPNGTILIVEDDEDDRFFMRNAFDKAKIEHAVRFVTCGDDAIAYMKGEGQYADREQFAYPTYIITDLRMQDGSGFDVLYYLKSNPKWAIIPTVVLSASENEEDIQMAYLLGASSYHIKSSGEDLQKQLKVLHEYWQTCQVPEVDITGKHLKTASRGRLGERYRNLLRDSLPNDDAEVMN